MSSVDCSHKFSLNKYDYDILYSYKTKDTDNNLYKNILDSLITDDTEYVQLLLFFCSNNLVKNVNLSNCCIENEQFIQTVKSVLRNKNIQHLNISSNMLSGEIFKKIANVVLSNKFLISVDFSNNMINGKNIDILCTIIRNKTVRLRHINLSNNCITDNDVYKLIKCLQKNRYLQSLDLSRNMITDSGVAQILGLDCAKTSLNKIVLTGNILGFESELKITELNLKTERVKIVT